MARGKKTDKNDADRVERQRQALEMRKAGASLRAIAEKLQVDKETIRHDIAATLADAKEVNADIAAENRALDLERIDRALLAIDEQVRKGHLGAIDRMERLIKRRAAIYGYDAPEKVDVTTGGKPIKGYTILANPDSWDEPT